MADKKIKAQVKLVIQAGQAKPVPPVGSTLGPYGLNLTQFCKDFNDKTATMTGGVPCVVTVFEDRTFEFVLKTPAVSELVKQALKVSSGSGDPLRKKIGKLSADQCRSIAEMKMVDLNCYDVDMAVKMVEGTCRSMGVQVEAA
jgi:large subunit ribosomal protein L11